MKHSRLALLALTSALLAGCGPSVPTSPETSKPTTAPSVSIVGANGAALPSTTLSGPVGQFRLKLADQDGQIQSVTWKVTQGNAAVSQGQIDVADIKADAVLTLPSLPAGTYNLTVTATDNSGLSSSKTITFTVDAQKPKLISVKVDEVAVANGDTLDRLVNQSTVLTVAASDDNSTPVINVYAGTTLVARGQGSLTFDLTSNTTGPVTYTVVSTDTVGNSVSQSFTIRYAQTNTETSAPSPVLQINNTDPEPYGNILSITASAGVAAGISVKQMILQVTDSRGIVDTTTFVTSSENATFNIDTTKYPDGLLKLQLIAIDSLDKRGASSVKSVTIANSVAPTITIVSPTNGANVSGPTNIDIQFRQNNTPFSFVNPNAKLEIVDGRGQVVSVLTAPITKVNQGLWQAVASVDFNATQYLNAQYTLRASTQVNLQGESSARTLVASSSVDNKSVVGEAPALNIILPVFYDAQAKLRPTLTRKSAVAVQVSDSDNIQRVQLQFVCDPITKLPTQSCNTDAYNFNIPIGAAGLFYRVFNTGVLIDGQPFVEDGNYVMRFTATDAAGNSNIREMAVAIDRSKTGIFNLGPLNTTKTESPTSKYTPASATWALSGTNSNTIRVLDLRYTGNDVATSERPGSVAIASQVDPNSQITITETFASAGEYKHDYLVQDLSTGVVEYYPGGVVRVSEK